MLNICVQAQVGPFEAKESSLCYLLSYVYNYVYFLLCRLRRYHMTRLQMCIYSLTRHGHEHKRPDTTYQYYPARLDLHTSYMVEYRPRLYYLMLGIQKIVSPFNF